MRLGVAARGAEPRWSVTSAPRHEGWLALEIPLEELAGLSEFDLHIGLHSSSGVEQADRACATLRGLK
ncbi:MAG: hypothetical protein ACK559_22345, partial [bacterium]